MRLWINTMCQNRNLGCQEKISLLTIVSCSPKSLMKCALIIMLKVSKQPWKGSRIYFSCLKSWRVFARWGTEPPCMHTGWLSFDITQVLLGYVKSIHVGNWELHLTAFECILPWFHAYDCQNYSPFFLPLL